MRSKNGNSGGGSADVSPWGFIGGMVGWWWTFPIPRKQKSSNFMNITNYSLRMYLVLMTGGIQRLPKALTEEYETRSSVDVLDRR